MKYGNLPRDLGLIALKPSEMMFWMYCPIMIPNETLTVPKNLNGFLPIVEAALDDYGDNDRYVYLTAKTLWVSGNYIGNRHGWHSDGFGTDDLNYIWSDRAPTEFFEDDFDLPENCSDAMDIMSERSTHKSLVTYSDRHLLALDPSVVHRSPATFLEGMRTFVKVSLSYDRYNLKGNSINHDLDLGWELVSRKVERNHPSA